MGWGHGADRDGLCLWGRSGQGVLCPGLRRTVLTGQHGMDEAVPRVMWGCAQGAEGARRCLGPCAVVPLG